MLQTIRTAGSFRFWTSLTFGLAVLPLAVSAALGYAMLSRGVLASFDDVAWRQRYQLDPTHHLRLLLWDAVAPIDAFVDDDDTGQTPVYRTLRQRIESGFAQLHGVLEAESEPRTLVERARADWTAADRLATEMLSARRAPDDPGGFALIQKFEGRIGAAVDKLGSVADVIETDLRADHDAAIRAYDRSEWLVGIAAGVSALTMLVGVVALGRLLTVSVDRLVDGAARFAAGDRSHRIEVQVPPELHRVAEEFNRMIRRIDESERALADLARRDGLTRLLNRRAFDEALAEAFARIDRLGERVALLILDIDHFKRINDTYGHSAGDEVLRAVARTIADDLRLFDHAFRIGGEEFAVLLAGADARAMRQTAERLRATVAARTTPIEGGAVKVTISIGGASATGVPSPGALVEAADAALYRAKTEGRDRVVVCGDAPSAAPHAIESLAGTADDAETA